jgi:hypothetical protein
MHPDPRDTCSAIAAESYKLWLEHENRTDDITIIIVHIRDAQNVSAQSFHFVGVTPQLLVAFRNSFFFPKFTQSGPAGSEKANCSSTGAPIALHAVQSGLPVFVASEANHLNGIAATPSSSSPTERRLSCVAPSPTHPLLEGGKASEASRPTQVEWHSKEGGNELEQPLQLQRPLSC